jgi:hypothetical protein
MAVTMAWTGCDQFPAAERQGAQHRGDGKDGRGQEYQGPAPPGVADCSRDQLPGRHPGDARRQHQAANEGEDTRGRIADETVPFAIWLIPGPWTTRTVASRAGAARVILRRWKLITRPGHLRREDEQA